MDPQEEVVAGEEIPQEETNVTVDVKIIVSKGKEIILPQVHTGETVHAIKQVLADFQETAVYTAFHLVVKHVVDTEKQKHEYTGSDYGDYTVIGNFLEANSKELVFTIQFDTYDVKKVKFHVDRLRDVCNRSHIPSGITKKTSDEEPATNDDAPKKAESKFVPKLEDVVDSVKLDKYFKEVLCLDNNKTAFNPDFDKLPLKNVIKSVYMSGWNPVPAQRKLQGDLMYLEVVLATEGTIHVTCTNRGFFVNKSNRNTFDPTPAAHPFFAHDLFGTISGYSQQTRAAWTTLCEASAAWFHGAEPGVLDGLIRNYVDMNINEVALPAGSWIAPAPASLVAETASQAKASYDVYRVQQSLADLCGVDELGAPREWNDEIQSIRSLQAHDDSEKIMKARLEYKIITEFSESCKKMVMAVAEGQLSPLTYGVPNESEVFSYNGIFVSRAEDIKDAFHIYDGDEAARKANSRDLANQKLIRTLEIDGLGSVLCTLVDYKGTRYIAQSIIPGILAQGEAGARLMYGIMEENKPITVKESSLKMMKELAEKLFLGTRHLPQYPFGAALDAAATEAKEAQDAAVAELDPLNKLIKSSEVLSTPIRIDEDDNVAVHADTQSVPHVGPIDTKIIRGTDGRNYLLEIMRLTPRDANYVPSETTTSDSAPYKGTNNIPAEDLQKIDASLAHTYILRQELVGIYLQRKVNLERSKLLVEAQGRQQEEREKLVAKAKETQQQQQQADVTVDDGEENAVKIVKETDAEKEQAAQLAAIDAELESTLTAEYAEKYRAINLQSVGLEINPNVFLPLVADVRAEQLAKDEETARDIATLLWEFVLPAYVRQVREGDVTPRDATALIASMHRTGINVRYLGRLTYLSIEQEREDTELFLQGKQRIHAMPQYFTELLLVEMIARSVKHVVNRHFRSNADFAAAPAASLASLLTHVMSALQEPEDATAAAAAAANNSSSGNNKNGKGKNNNNNAKKDNKPAATGAATATGTAATAAAATTNNTSSGNNKKKGDKKKVEEPLLLQSTAGVDVVDAPVDIFADKTALFQELHQMISQRFLFNMSIYDEAAEEDVFLHEEDAAAALANLTKKLLAKSSLRRRVNPVVLLRRICQQLGLVIVARDYAASASTAVTTTAKNTASNNNINNNGGIVITANDIVTLLPRVKTCEPDTYLPDFQDYLASSAAYLQQGNGLAAFEAAQEALNMITQVTGTAHEQAFQAMDQLTAVFVATADVKAATHMSARTLALSAQVQGLDCSETIQHHIQLAMLQSEMDDVSLAFRHLLAAKFIVQLVAGDRHPELGNIFFRLSTLYEKIGNYDAAMLCIHSARRLTSDLGRNGMLAQAEAALAFRHYRFQEAVQLQKHGYRLVRDIFGVEDERVQVAKKNLEMYIRSSSEALNNPQIFANMKSALADVEQEDEEDNNNDNNGTQQNNKKRSKKNKNKGGKK